MDLKAVIVLGSSEQPEAERWAGHQLASLEVLGKPVTDHMIDRLRRFGVDSATVVTPQGAEARAPRRGVNVVTAAADQLWRSAETVFNLYAQTGAEIVIVMRMGAYVEIDLDHLLHFHHENKNRVTRVVDAAGNGLGIAVIDGSRRNDAAFLFRTQLQETRVPGADYQFLGYVNPLREVSDLRKLTQDALMLDCELRPEGQEIKPGVWTAEDAQIDKDARLVAPCFVGAGAKVRAGAVITRMSSVERSAEVDVGTMVEDSTVLPLSYVGPGLDVCHSVLGYSKVANLPRNATVAVCDPKITAELSSSAILRRVGDYAESVTRAAAAVVGSFTAKRSAQPAETGVVEHAPALAEKTRAAVR